jgi:hypothetical protein
MVESIDICVNSFRSSTDRRHLLGGMFLTSGLAMCPGFKERMCGKLRARARIDSLLNMVRLSRVEFVLQEIPHEAWPSASLFADRGGSAFSSACIGLAARTMRRRAKTILGRISHAII